MTSQDENLTGRRPHRKTTSQEDKITGTQSHRKINSQDDYFIGKQPNRKKTNGMRHRKTTRPQEEKQRRQPRCPSKLYLDLSLAQIGPSLFIYIQWEGASTFYNFGGFVSRYQESSLREKILICEHFTECAGSI